MLVKIGNKGDKTRVFSVSPWPLACHEHWWGSWSERCFKPTLLHSYFWSKIRLLMKVIHSKLGDNVLCWSFGRFSLSIVCRTASGIIPGSEHWKCEEHLSVHIMLTALFLWLALSFVKTVVLYKLMGYLAIRLAEFCRNNYQAWHCSLELGIKSLLVTFTVGTNISRKVCNDEMSTILLRDLLHLII